MEIGKVPSVSILCGCFNQSKFIMESLDSIKNQTFQDYEVIIWDDASVDNSVDIIEKWIIENPSINARIIKHETNFGVCKSLNECFTLSKGKYIQMLALDDVLMPDKIERQVKFLERSAANDALIFSDANIINDNSELLGDRTFIEVLCGNKNVSNGINFYEHLLNQNFIPGMSVLLKREIIQDVGLWDENLAYEDYDMWLRISDKYNFLFDNELSVKYRVHNNNFHKQSQVLSESSFDIYIKHKHKIAKRKMYELLMYAPNYKYLKENHYRYNQRFVALTAKERVLRSYHFLLCYRFILSLKVKLHYLIKPNIDKTAKCHLY